MHPNSRYRRLILLAAGGLLLLTAAVFSFGILPLLKPPAAPSATQPTGHAIGFGSGTVRAKVLSIEEEGSITLGGQTQPYQIGLVKLLEGPHQGKLVEIDYGQRQLRPTGAGLVVGQEVLVTVSQLPDGTVNVYFTDFVRSRPLLWLLATFVVFSVLISGWKGVRSLLAMAFSLFVITSYIIPQILQGRDPVWVSISGAFVLLAVTLYVTYGWTLKTHAAVVGVLLALILTGLLADFFVNLTRLTGFGSEDALFLIQQSQVKINLRGLVLGGMLIGALGVLDDLVITQASAVIELYQTDPSQSLSRLYRSGMRIGSDHVAATVNTLVLAYAGAALPTLLLFSLSGEQFAYLVNLEFVTEELVRTLVGSLGLMAAVPITTALTALLASRQERLGRLRRWLGPEGGSGHGG